ncbi:hypothetical protein NC99_30790 [Sunxiuqinia dokdonensis]|uniref:Uncharacterized protein n=1 Tax=Sunxiuqinia dokdonensis TaxID=1409788 RepID=A0A0L8V6M0_9BACT|nr:hypothetical protein NC99_30790 [Sunxiuqinia dokdonensis]
MISWYSSFLAMVAVVSLAKVRPVIIKKATTISVIVLVVFIALSF